MKYIIQPDYLKKILIFITLGLLCGYLGFCIPTVISANIAYPENPRTQAYFTKICEMPNNQTNGPCPETFWEKGGDCDDRAHIFKQYLIGKGAKDVQICWMNKLENGEMVKIRTGDYGHQFVLWNGRAYNPAHKTKIRFYNADLDEYINFCHKRYGYNIFYYENGTVIKKI